MNYSTMALLASDDIIAVSCVFRDNDKQYTYKTTMKDLKKDDLVTVQCTGNSNFYGYCIVKVADIDVDVDLNNGIEYKWIVGKLDLDSFNETLETEKELIKHVRKLERRNKAKQVRDAFTKLISFNSENESEGTK